MVQTEDEKKRLSFLIEKKTRDLKRLKEQEKELLHQLIHYRDQLKKIEREEKERQWREDEKKEERSQKKRDDLFLKALEKRGSLATKP